MKSKRKIDDLVELAQADANLALNTEALSEEYKKQLLSGQPVVKANAEIIKQNKRRKKLTDDKIRTQIRDITPTVEVDINKTLQTVRPDIYKPDALIAEVRAEAKKIADAQVRPQLADMVPAIQPIGAVPIQPAIPTITPISLEPQQIEPTEQLLLPHEQPLERKTAGESPIVEISDLDIKNIMSLLEQSAVADPQEPERKHLPTAEEHLLEVLESPHFADASPAELDAIFRQNEPVFIEMFYKSARKEAPSAVESKIFDILKTTKKFDTQIDDLIARLTQPAEVQPEVQPPEEQPKETRRRRKKGRPSKAELEQRELEDPELAEQMRIQREEEKRIQELAEQAKTTEQEADALRILDEAFTINERRMKEVLKKGTLDEYIELMNRYRELNDEHARIYGVYYSYNPVGRYMERENDLSDGMVRGVNRLFQKKIDEVGKKTKEGKKYKEMWKMHLQDVRELQEAE